MVWSFFMVVSIHKTCKASLRLKRTKPRAPVAKITKILEGTLDPRYPVIIACSGGVLFFARLREKFGPETGFFPGRYMPTASPWGRKSFSPKTKTRLIDQWRDCLENGEIAPARGPPAEVAVANVNVETTDAPCACNMFFLLFFKTTSWRATC